METILVVNAGSSSVKFQIFGIEDAGALQRLIRGQVDAIGSRPRLAGEAYDKLSLIDSTYASDKVPDVPAAKHAAALLRERTEGGQQAQEWLDDVDSQCTNAQLTNESEPRERCYGESRWTFEEHNG